MSYYSEVNPPSVYWDDCPCANSEEGFDPACTNRSCHERHATELATADLDTRCQVHNIRCCTICIPEGDHR